MDMFDQKIFEANIESLRRAQPQVNLAMVEHFAHAGGAFELVAGRSGLPTLRFGDGTGGVGHVHSLFDPVREARKRAEILAAEKKDVYVFIGFGLGYTVAALLPLLPVGSCVVVFEPGLDAFSKAMGAMPLREVIEHPRVFLLPDGNIAPYRECLVNFLGNFSPREIAFDELPHAKLFGDYRVAVSELVTGIANLCVSLKYTRTSNQAMNQLNAAYNLKYLMKNAPLSSLADVLKGMPAVIVGPGIGLMKSLRGLSALRQHCAIISMNTTAPFLVQNSIVPHFIIAIDPQEVILKKLGTDIPKECEFIFADFTYRGAVEAYGEQAFVFPTSGPIMHALGASGLQYPAMATGPTVATAALRLAAHLGASPIAFTGLDFQFYKGNRYPWDIWNIYREYDMVENVLGGMAQTTPELAAYAGEFAQFLSQLGARFVDIRETGLRIPDVEISDWKSFLLNLPDSGNIDFTAKYMRAMKEHSPSAISAKRRFAQDCIDKFPVLKEEIVGLYEKCAELLSAWDGTRKEDVYSIINETEKLSAEPLWHLLRGYFHPVQVSALDITDESSVEKQKTVIEYLKDYFEKTIALFDAAANAFK